MPYVALPLTVATSVFVAPNEMLALVGLLTVVLMAVETLKHSSLLSSELAV